MASMAPPLPATVTAPLQDAVQRLVQPAAVEYAREVWEGWWQSEPASPYAAVKEPADWWITCVFRRALYLQIVRQQPVVKGPAGRPVPNPLEETIATLTRDIDAARARLPAAASAVEPLDGPQEHPADAHQRQETVRAAFEAAEEVLAPLSNRQRAFVLEVCLGKSATQAYIDAGYSPRGARGSSSTLRANPSVARAITAIEQDSLRRLTPSIDMIRHRVLEIAMMNQDPAEYASWDGERLTLKPSDQLPKHVRMGIASIEFEEEFRYDQRGRLMSRTPRTRVRQHSPGVALSAAKLAATFDTGGGGKGIDLETFREIVGEDDDDFIGLPTGSG